MAAAIRLALDCGSPTKEKRSSSWGTYRPAASSAGELQERLPLLYWDIKIVRRVDLKGWESSGRQAFPRHLPVLRPRTFTLGGSGARLALIVWIVSLSLASALVPREQAHPVDFADDRVAAQAGADRICYEAGAFAVLPHLYCGGDTLVRPGGTIVSGCHPLPPMFWPPWWLFTL